MTERPNFQPLSAEDLAEVAKWDAENVDHYCDGTRWRATVDTLQAKIAHLGFLVDFLYEALGPANDDIMDMAEEAWTRV